jgi:predicted amidohydrolase
MMAEVATAGTCLEGDCQNGYGTFQWNDGSKFSGHFAVADPDGEGIYTDADGNEFHVTYQDGRPVASTPITKEEKERKARQREAERYNEAGLTFLRKKDNLSAIFFFNKAITLWPDNPVFHKNYRMAKGLK